MNNLKIGFIILHYQNKDVTDECIQYLLKLNNISNHKIIIVDNCSPNGTGEIIENQYESIDNICILRLKENYGFATGNNKGYQYAREQLAIDIAIVMNSDVYIKNTDFITKVLECISNNQEISIIAPDIINKNGYHQNPYLLKPISNQEQIKILLKKMIGYVLYSIPLLKKKLIARKSINKISINEKEENIQKNIIPHGSCIIYTPNWIKQEKKVFVEGTFLFVEEELLYDYCELHKHSIAYFPNLVVYHMEDASQDAITDNAIKKKKNQIKNEIKSRKVLLKERRKMKGN